MNSCLFWRGISWCERGCGLKDRNLGLYSDSNLARTNSERPCSGSFSLKGVVFILILFISDGMTCQQFLKVASTVNAVCYYIGVSSWMKLKGRKLWCWLSIRGKQPWLWRLSSMNSGELSRRRHSNLSWCIRTLSQNLMLCSSEYFFRDLEQANNKRDSAKEGWEGEFRKIFQTQGTAVDWQYNKTKSWDQRLLVKGLSEFFGGRIDEWNGPITRCCNYWFGHPYGLTCAWDYDLIWG